MEELSGTPTALELRKHSKRAFACAALLRAREEPWNYRGDAASANYNLIQLISSLDAFPSGYTLDAIKMLAWMLIHSDLEGDDEQNIFYCVGLLWLGLQSGITISDQQLIEISEWIVRREADLHRRCKGTFDRWLLGIANDPPPSPWEELGKKLSSLDLRNRSQLLQEWVKLIGEELSGKNR